MGCFICPIFGERRCEGSCGLGCTDCPETENQVATDNRPDQKDTNREGQHEESKG